MSARISFEEACEKLGKPAELEDAGEVIDDLRQRAEAAECEAERLRRTAITDPGLVYEKLKHGDAEHRRWLHEACHALARGENAPPPRGKGTDAPALDGSG